MRAYVLALSLILLVAGGARTSAASHPDPAAHDHSDRIGVLPDSWVETLESAHISEQTALIAGGATAAALGVGAVAGASAGGATGATLFALWLAHWPVQIALMGGTGYLAWNYLWPEPRKPLVVAPGPSIDIGWRP
ncbi:hypothetical protein [Thalassobaculum fulvum]|nr:hypothetical protein [Thalassobaculum fulvum]